ncbi:MAG: U32 family peptidase [Deltaproteobacteria bacterium]|nr:U32 family peptidase [Candidatus Anaeroferrophillus wilburensis]MBN2889564.1 U32 family peptidase [Deltaproteobacteria bacterium]
MKKPELLAPAGNLETFFAALDAGADAIYLGGKEFSARQRAKNFSSYELERMIPYAHQRGVKIYVTVNTLLKEEELPSLYRFFSFLRRLEVDALIVQDPGVIHLLRRDFPELPVHISTQASIHNAWGVARMDRLGCKRVVLARELSLEEIAAISRETSLELEVFVFGALCLSVAGLCLFSSFLGGQSGNRGRCTQPCRRLYAQSRKTGYYLSPADFSALPFLPQLMALGITSCKIEGRLKSSHYVGTVTGVFRQAIDEIVRDGVLQPERQAALARRLRSAFTRPLNSANLSGVYSPVMIDPRQHGSMGQQIGTVLAVRNRSVRVSLSDDLLAGDRLKVISGGRDGKDNAFTISKGVEGNGLHGKEVWLPVPVDCHPGDLLVKVGGKDYYSSKGSRFWLEKLKQEVSVAPCSPAGPKCYDLQRLLVSTPAAVTTNRGTHRTRWRLKVASWEHVQQFSREEDCTLIADLNLRLIAQLAGQEAAIFRRYRRRLAWWLPPVHFPGQEQSLAEAVKRLLAAGFRQFYLNNLGQLELFADRSPKGLHLATGSFLPATNLAAVAAYRSWGFTSVMLSAEMDRQSLKVLCERSPADLELMVLAFGFQPLLVTRMSLPVSAKKIPLTSPHGEIFHPIIRDGLTYLVPGQPLMVTSLLKKLFPHTSPAFLLDFSWYPPGWKPAAMLAAIRQGKPISGASSFNLSRKWQ